MLTDSQTHYAMDEKHLTPVVAKLYESGKLKVAWERFLLNFPENRRADVIGYPSFLNPHLNRWRWQDGKVYFEEREIMYLHFMTWKSTLRQCKIRPSQNPKQFYISHTHISVKKRPTPLAVSLALGMESSKIRRMVWKIASLARSLLGSRFGNASKPDSGHP